MNSLNENEKELIEFIYLDMDFVNSLSAQLFEGNIIEKYLGEEFGIKKGVTNAQGSTERSAFGGNVGLNIGVAKTEMRGDEHVDTHEQESLSEQELQNASESITIAINEYAFNNVIHELNERGYIKKSGSAMQYEYTETTNNFRFFDFSKHTDIYNYNRMVELIMFDEMQGSVNFEQIEAYVKQAKGIVNRNTKKYNDILPNKVEAEKFLEAFNNSKIFASVERLSNYMKSIFDNHFILMSEDNELVICKKENIKVPSITLTLAGEVKAKVYGKIINDNSKEVNIDAFLKITKQMKPEEIIAKGAEFFIINFLTNMYGLKESEPYNLIQPIGIQFER